jgi:N-acetylmuramoyl-L-alanine amidase
VFASKIQGQMVKLGRKDRCVKQAGFLVLYKTTMPSVLIETGFLSNHKEELFLRDTANQTKMATSFFNAFEEYKTYYEKDMVSGNANDVAEEETTDFGLNEELISEDDVIFRVQIETNENKLSLKDSRFKGNPIWMYENNDLYKYTVGAFKKFSSANELKKIMREKGFEHAFVVAFHKNERINLEKAIKLAEN